MRTICLTLLSIFIYAATSFASFGYNYISIADMKANLAAKKPMIILDIQVKEEFQQHHLKGSIATYAYPVKTDSEKSKIDQVIAVYKAECKDIVIVCPRGAGGAKRAYKYLESQNIPEDNLHILEDGMQGWPYKEYVAAN